MRTRRASRGLLAALAFGLATATAHPASIDPDLLRDLDAAAEAKATPEPEAEPEPAAPDAVQCAVLVYAGTRTSRCFATRFLADMDRQTSVRVRPTFVQVRADSSDLYRHPFAVMTGEGAFQLTPTERDNLRHYLENGGFLIASAGCSSRPWAESFRREIETIFPGRSMTRLTPEHPVFHTVHAIGAARDRRGQTRFPELYGIEVDGRLALIFSADGLNDTANAGRGCCCCGGNEIRSAREININILAYALTH